MIEIIIRAADKLPVGGRRLIRFLARFSKTLRHYPVKLKLLPDVTYYADLREAVFYPVYKYGGCPNKQAEDLVARKILRPGDIVCDIGANIGYTTLLYADIVKKNGHVFAFEPSKKCVEYLKENLKGWENITLVPKAVSNKVSRIPFSEQKYLDRSGVPSSQIVRQANGQMALYNVEATTLDTFFSINKLKPDFIKIDVEGHEQEVFEGAIEVIRNCKPIILFEALNKDCYHQNQTFLNKISEGGYKFLRIMNNTFIEDAETDDLNATDNYLAIPAWASERLSSVKHVVVI